jgi:hypothetical protein
MAASVRMRRFVSGAFADLFDQRSPFGRLALVHVLMTAGDTLLTISLAGSLFFSISPDAAKSKVLLYLFLTMAPFAVVAPILGPLIDRSRGARRAMVVFSGAARAVVCVLLVGQLKTLLLFPLAFVMLVLSKVYLVTKGALVPQLLGPDGRGLTTTSGPAPPASAGPRPGERGPTAATSPSPGPDPGAEGRSVPGDPPQALAIVNARLGLLASLSGIVASLPAIAVLRLLGAPWVLRLNVLVFIAATIAGLRLPVPRRARTGVGETDRVHARSSPPGARPAPRDARRPSALTVLASGPAVHPEVTLALSTMSVLRGLVGFLTFMMAFDLRRKGVALGWYGFVLGASVAGAVVGVLLVPRARRLLTEQQMLVLSVWFVAAAGIATAIVGGIAVQGALAFSLGLAAAAAKPAFDALVQRYVPPEAQGRAFARFETRLQLAWVAGSLVPVIAAIPLSPGDIVVAAVAGVSGAFYLTGRRALGGRAPDGPPGGQPSRRPSAST